MSIVTAALLLPTQVLFCFSAPPPPHNPTFHILATDVATGLRARKRAFPRSGKICKEREKKILFPKYRDTHTRARTRSLTKTHARESSLKSVVLFFNGKVPYWHMETCQSQGACDHVFDALCFCLVFFHLSLLCVWDTTTGEGSPLKHGKIIFIFDAILEDHLHINS